MRKRAFTYVELGAVVLLIAMFAALVMPNLIALQHSREIRSFYTDVVRFVRSAREMAIARNQTLELRVGQGDSFEIVVPATEEAEAQVLETKELPQELRFGSFRLDGQESTAETWSVRFYFDGAAQSAMAEILEGNASRTLRIGSRDARVDLLQGNMPDEEPDEWEAGQIEIRQQTEAAPAP